MNARRGLRRISKGLYVAPNGRDTVAHRPWVGWRGKWVAEWTDKLGAKQTRAFVTLGDARNHLLGRA